MKYLNVSLPQLALVVGTRAALGAGIGMLLGSRLGEKPRRATGWALVAIGVLTTVPLAAGLFRAGRGRSRIPAAAKEFWAA